MRLSRVRYIGFTYRFQNINRPKLRTREETGNSRELIGKGNTRELKRTQRNSKGTRENSRELEQTPGYSRVFQGPPGNSRDLQGTQENLGKPS